MEPRFSFAFVDVQYLVTFAVMVMVALVIGQKMAGLTYQARVAQRRENRPHDMARELSGSLMAEQAAIGLRFLTSEFSARSALLAADYDNKLQPLLASGDAPQIYQAIAQWSFAKAEPASYGTDTLLSSTFLYLPLSAPMRARDVLAVQPRDSNRLVDPEQRPLLETCASLLAISLERIHYIHIAQETTVQMESESLRNSLLSAISHDLRTLLSMLVGLAETLKLNRPELGGEAAEIATAMGGVGAAHEHAGQQPAGHGGPGRRQGGVQPPMAAGRGGGRQRAVRIGLERRTGEPKCNCSRPCGGRRTPPTHPIFECSWAGCARRSRPPLRSLAT